MKKLVSIILALVLFVIPSICLADETKEPVNIYLFKGKTCSHCHEFLEWIDSLDDDIKAKFNLIECEVWYNTVNNTAMSKVAEIMGDDVSGVPYFVIGETSFAEGFKSSMADSIIDAIEKEYEKDTRYDVVKENNITIEPDGVEKEVEKEKTNPIVITAIFAFIIIGGGALVYISTKSGL